MNGLCPACRRPYSDKDIEYKIITPEESAAHKARQAQKQKKTQAALQKEKQKAEADNLSRKHLAGLRVVQKNLVYVTGLNPSSQEDQLLQTLRGDSYFGQYGKIIKIVVSKAKDPLHPQSVGVYVTYERKEDAESCIAAVNGTNNGGHTLRAQCGTTKYCSAYLRGENCTNRNCMFLHEPGEANESYSRADLSALNAGSSQHGSGRAPPPQSQQPVASASQPMARQSSSDRPQSPAVDRPALPSTASWASRPSQAQPSQTQSRSTSGTIESDGMTAQVAPAPPTQPTSQPEQPTQSREQPIPAHAPSENPIQTVPQQQKSRKARDPFASLVLDFKPEHLKFNFGFPSTMSEADIEIIKNYPPLFDPNGGAKRRLRREREEEQRRMQQEALAFQQPPGLDMDENLEMSGSLQLGGEPEERQPLSQPHSAIQPPGPDGLLDQRFQFGGVSSPVTSDRGLTPQQHQQYLLRTMKSPNAESPFLNNMNPPTSFQQSSNPPGHQRNASRYSFANESTASTAVKPVANAKLLNQQSSIMPPVVTGGNNFGAQPHGNQFFTSNVQGPPPGLKTTGTPPVSGGMTFGQGHGFATGGIQYGALANSATGRNANEEMMRNLLRGGRDAPTPTDVAAKRELHPSFSNHQYSSPHPGGANAFPSGLSSGPPSYSSFSGEEKQRKKKGKKHRHANTSSSSVSGGVDSGVSSDPSVLQARFTGQNFGNGQTPYYNGMHGGGYGGGRW